MGQTSGRAWTDSRTGETWTVHMLPEDWGDHSTPPLGRVQLRFVRNGSRTRVVDYETNEPLDALTDDRMRELFDRAD